MDNNPHFSRRSVASDPTMTGVTLIVLAILTYAVYRYKKTYTFWSSRGIRGPTPLPIFGNALTYIFNPIADIDVKYSKKYGKVYGIYQGWDPVLITSDPELIEKVYVTHHPSFRFHIKPPTNDPAIINAVVFKDGEDWKRVRNVFSTGVTPSKLKECFELMINNQDLRDYIKGKEGKELKGIELFTIYVLNTIIQVFYALDFDLFNHLDHEVLFHSRNLVEDFNILPFLLSQCLPSFLYDTSKTTAGKAIRYLANVASFAMDERKKLLKEAKALEGKNFKPRNDFLQLMMDANMSQIEKVSNLSFGLIEASMDTTALTLAYLFDELGRNNHVLRRLQRDIDPIFWTSDENGKARRKEINEITFEEVQSQTYLEWCIYETLRLRPTDSRSFRRASEETTIPDTDIMIPKIVAIQVAVVPLHHDPELFENPKEFNPDRWSEEKRKTMKKCSFMSFGAGPRQCPGRQFGILNAKIAVISILRDYEVEVSDTSQNVKLGAGKFVCEATNFLKFVSRK